MGPTAMPLPGTVKEVATSNSTEYALLANGTLYAWGQGDRGELGDGGTANSFKTPVRVRFPTGVKINWLPTDAMPYDTGLAVDTTGQAWGWGLNSDGVLCLNNTSQYATPVRLPFSDVTAMAGAGDHALFDNAGGIFACGSNAYGDLGDSSTNATFVPVAVPALNDRHVTVLVASFNNSGALAADGSYYNWGYDGEGQLGQGRIGDASSEPVQVTLPAKVTQVVLGGSNPTNGQTVVKLSNGALYGWGANENAQLRAGEPTSVDGPILIAPPAGVTYACLATGGATTYGVTTRGDVYAWGNGYDGQIGNGERNPTQTPTLIESGATQVSATANNVATI